MDRNEISRFLQPSLVAFQGKPESPEWLRWYTEAGEPRVRPLDFNQLLRAWRKRHPDMAAKAARDQVKTQSQAGVDDQALWAQLPIEQLATIIGQMQQCIEQHGLEVLQRYPADLFVHDRNMLLQYWAPGAVFGWSVTDCSTHLVPIGLHPALQNIEVIVGQASRQRYFKIEVGATSAKIQEVSEEAFKLLLKTPVPYRYQDGLLVRGASRTLGAIHVAQPPRVSDQRTTVLTVTVRPVTYRSELDAVALWAWANQLPIETAGTLWARWEIQWLENALQLAA